ncbi:MAG TPA: hypothetical protein VF254_06375 [Gammaproteobacteria bacterium]
MNHNQQENQGPGGKRDRARKEHDRQAQRAGNQRHDTQSDPAKFDEDLPYEQQPAWQREGEEGRYRDTYNAARDERPGVPATRTAHGGGHRGGQSNPARVRDDDARAHDQRSDLPPATANPRRTRP